MKTQTVKVYFTKRFTKGIWVGRASRVQRISFPDMGCAKIWVDAMRSPDAQRSLSFTIGDVVYDCKSATLQDDGKPPSGKHTLRVRVASGLRFAFPCDSRGKVNEHALAPEALANWRWVLSHGNERLVVA